MASTRDPNIADHGLIGDLQPRFDYGRAKHKIQVSGHGAVLTGSDGTRLTVHTVDSASDVLDSSLLMMPLQGIAPRDPMWLSTLAAMDDKLVSDSLVYRYNPAMTPDGLRGREGTSRCARSGTSTLFPQAFSHLALIGAAINLDYQLDHGPATSGCSRQCGDRFRPP